MCVIFFLMILPLILTTNLLTTVLHEIQTNRLLLIVSHMRWSMLLVVNFRGVCFRLIRLSCRCGLLNGLPGRRSVVTNSGDLTKNCKTEADYDKFVDSFEDNYVGVCNGRPIWMIDRRKFDDRDSDKSLRTHDGRNPSIMFSIM